MEEQTQATENQPSTDTSNQAAVQETSANTVSDNAPKSLEEKIEKLSSKSTKTKTSKEADASLGATGSTATQAPVVPPPYTPNYKFKSYDKEFEFDEWARQAIKDKETEEKVRDLFTKAYGMDFLKPKYQETREKFQEIQGKHNTLMDNIGMLEGYLNQGDLGQFFKTLQIPEQMVQKWVYDQLQYKDLPPDQRQRIDQFNDTRQRAMMLERQNKEYEQRWQQEATQLRSIQLDSVMSRPDIKGIADAYDARKGKPGAFRERVILEGKNHWNASGRDLTPEEAVREVVAMVDYPSLSQGQMQSLQTSGANQAPTAPPVIPNIAGKATSPAKKIIKNLSDLRKLGAEG